MFAIRFIVFQTAQKFCRGLNGETLRYTSISPIAASLFNMLRKYCYITVQESHTEEIKPVYVGLFEMLLIDNKNFESKILVFVL